MKTIAVAFLSSLAVSLVVAPIVLAVSRRKSPNEDPERERKTHSRSIPCYGGVAIIVAFFIPLIALYFWENLYQIEVFSDAERIVWFLLLAVASFSLGFIDDIRRIPARWRLLVQIIIGILAWNSGFRVESISIFDGVISFSPTISILLTALWFVLIMNAINLIDGLDGLAGGIVLLVTLSVTVLAIFKGAIFMSFMTAALAGALVGFLVFNFSPARLFMGDGGAYFLGFSIAALTLDASLKTHAICIVFIPVLALGIPIFDTVYAFFRRTLKGIPFSHADKHHIHHRLRQMGFNSRQAVAILYLITATGCFAAISFVVTAENLPFAAIVVYGAAAVIMVKLAGVRGIVNTIAHICKKYCERRKRFCAYKRACDSLLNKSPNNEIFSNISDFCAVMKFSSIRIQIGDMHSRRSVFSWMSPNQADSSLRRLSIPVGPKKKPVGEIEFAIAEDLADVFNRDKEFIDSLAWNIGEWLKDLPIGTFAPREQKEVQTIKTQIVAPAKAFYQGGGL